MYLDEKTQSFKDSKPVPVNSYPTLTLTTPARLKFCCNRSPAQNREEASPHTQLLLLTSYTSATARKRPEPVLGTHGNSGTRLLAAHLRSSRGQEGSDEQYGTSFGGEVSVACLLFSYLGIKSKTSTYVCCHLFFP